METKHLTLRDMNFEFCEGKKFEQEDHKQVLTTTNVAALRASYLMANHIAKAKKNFAVGEELILSAAKDILCEHVPINSALW